MRLKTNVIGNLNMPAGGPGDHPITDILFHNLSRIPNDMTMMVKKILTVDRSLQTLFINEIFSWERKENIKEGRIKLKEIIKQHNIEERFKGFETKKKTKNKKKIIYNSKSNNI